MVDDGDKLQRWADLEMIAELRRLHDADCVQFDVWMGAPIRQLDAAHLIPRLLTLAEKGARSSLPAVTETRMAEDMILRGAIALGNWWRTTPAEDRVSNVGAVRAILLAALDLTPDELEEIGRDLRWSNSYERMDGLRSVLIALKQMAQGETR